MGRGLVASSEGCKRARSILKARNLTQQRFSEQIGLSYTTINNFLNAKPVDRINFEEICKFLDLNWEDIAEQLSDIEQLWQKLQEIGFPYRKNGTSYSSTRNISLEYKTTKQLQKIRTSRKLHSFRDKF